jgi:hypothetical protein
LISSIAPGRSFPPVTPRPTRPVSRERPVECTRLVGWGLPCCVGSPCVDMPSPLPRWVRWADRSWLGLSQPVASFTNNSGLPPMSDGSASTFAFSTPARRSLALRPAYSPRRHAACFLEGFDGFVASTAAPIATGSSDPVAGWDLHPLKSHTFSRRTDMHSNLPHNIAHNSLPQVFARLGLLPRDVRSGIRLADRSESRRFALTRGRGGRQLRCQESRARFRTTQSTPI